MTGVGILNGSTINIGHGLLDAENIHLNAKTTFNKSITLDGTVFKYEDGILPILFDDGEDE